MDDQERLLRLSEELDQPVQVSGTDGATRQVADRVEQARTGTEAAQSDPGSCYSWNGWGN
jgi:hypothetical protein